MVQYKLTLIFLLCSIHAFGMVLVDQGRPAAVIIVAEKPADSVRYAAAELQTYLHQITGATLPIQIKPENEGVTIYVGESEFTKKLGVNTHDLKSDGFKIVTGDNWIAILGRDYSGPPVYGLMNPWNYNEVYNEKLKIGAFGETGTLFGVYRFLEDVGGVRWYMPGDLGTVIPKQKTIRVDKINLQASPAFEYRYPWFCNFPASEPDARWYRRAGFGAPAPAQCIHSFMFFLKYKDTHPEYFALIGGKRDFTNLSCVGGGGNLCLSNPDVAQQWITDICEYLKNNPQQRIYPLAPNDGMTKICECEECQKQIDKDLGDAGMFSNYFWTFADKVARGVGEKYPDKFVGSIAYANCTTPPTRLKNFSPNLAVMVCQTRGGFADPKSKNAARKAIEGWRTKTKNIYIWEYYLYSWPPMRGLPVFFPHLIADDLKYLNGVGKGEFIESESNLGGTGKIDCPGLAHLNLYLTARLLWNPDLNVDRLLAEYYEKFYGPACDQMKGFWTLAEKIWMTRSTLGDPINVYPKDDLNTLMAFLTAAKTKTPDGSIYRKRIELIESEFLPAKRALSNVLVLHPPTLTVKGPVPPVKIDGLLNDEAWKKTEPFGFVDKNGETAPFKTWGYAAWDEQTLYLAFLNYEPDMNKLTAECTQRDQNYGPGMWEDDSVELFLCPNSADKTGYLQFIINANGLIWDAKISRDSNLIPAVDWNSRARSAVKREENRWVLEIQIPLSDLGLTMPIEGKTIFANFFRNRYSGGPGVYACWSPSLTIQHGNTDRFGKLEFKNK